MMKYCCTILPLKTFRAIVDLVAMWESEMGLMETLCCAADRPCNYLYSVWSINCRVSFEEMYIQSVCLGVVQTRQEPKKYLMTYEEPNEDS